jgi:hypothetical protein
MGHRVRCRTVSTLEQVPAGPRRRPDQQSTLDGNDRLFVFDGECGFCTKWAGWLEHRVGAAARFLPFQALDDLGTFGLTIEDVRTASYLIESGAVSRRSRVRTSDGARPRDVEGHRSASGHARSSAHHRHRLPVDCTESTSTSCTSSGHLSLAWPIDSERVVNA